MCRRTRLQHRRLRSDVRDVAVVANADVRPVGPGIRTRVLLAADAHAPVLERRFAGRSVARAQAEGEYEYYEAEKDYGPATEFVVTHGVVSCVSYSAREASSSVTKATSCSYAAIAAA